MRCAVRCIHTQHGIHSAVSVALNSSEHTVQTTSSPFGIKPIFSICTACDNALTRGRVSTTLSTNERYKGFLNGDRRGRTIDRLHGIEEVGGYRRSGCRMV